MARPHRSSTYTMTAGRRSLPVDFYPSFWGSQHPMVGYVPPMSHFAPFNPVPAGASQALVPARPPQNQTHISTYSASVGPMGPPPLPVNFNNARGWTQQQFDLAIRSCGREIDRWRYRMAQLEALRSGPVPSALVRSANNVPPAHQLPGRSSEVLPYTCPPAPRLNGNLPLPDVGDLHTPPRTRADPTRAGGLQLTAAQIKAHGEVYRFETYTLSPSQPGTSVEPLANVADAGATSTTAVHASARDNATASPPPRVMTSEDQAVLNGLMELRRRSESTSTVLHDTAGSTRASRRDSTASVGALTLRTTGLVLHADGEESDAPTPGLSRSPSDAEGTLSQSSTQQSLFGDGVPSVLGLPEPEFRTPIKTFDMSSAHAGRRNPNSSPHNRVPLTANISNDNRFALRTTLPLTFDNFPPDGYPIINRENGEPIGWSAGPAPVLNSIAGCIRRGDAAPTPGKDKSNHVTFEKRGKKEVDSEESGNDSDDKGKAKKTAGKGKGKARAKDSSKLLLSPRRAMKAAKKAKLDHKDD
ncbi:hypothetical protein CALVIDRAFT_534720 [Calocera viscosa TUFC12733]|uniref:Uncharacterized protein n=1 Tax=Calocera viscosa (strain TUFC12733) TaxID=1330018 RepID=A0A167PW46_CALVF|nr:hypothetical protein CALVIDRAFT_534720 [Calocera viscosa TUFC12733]